MRNGTFVDYLLQRPPRPCTICRSQHPDVGKLRYGRLSLRRIPAADRGIHHSDAVPLFLEGPVQEEKHRQPVTLTRVRPMSCQGDGVERSLLALRGEIWEQEALKTHCRWWPLKSKDTTRIMSTSNLVME